MGKSFARFSVFARGMIVGMHLQGASRQLIRKTVKKKDGKQGNLRAIDSVVAHARADPSWDGKDSSAGGRPRQLSSEQEQQVLGLVRRDVGVAVVTVRYLKKRLPFLRRISQIDENPGISHCPWGS